MSKAALVATFLVFILLPKCDGILSNRLAKSFLDVFDTALQTKKDPHLHYNAEELTCSAGYPTEAHKVETEDGYILTLHRIPYGRDLKNERFKRNIRSNPSFHYGLSPAFKNCKNGSAAEGTRRTPILLMHGLYVSSDSWLLQGPGYDLAYLLADAGYDVWLGNGRGNFYSRNHRSLKPTDEKFWDFSFHEMGYYDLPAFIDYILEKTNFPKMFYAGHSMGTTMFFVLMSTRPEYNDKIRLFSGMAPAAQFNYEQFSPRKKTLVTFGTNVAKWYKDAKLYEVFPRENWTPLLFNAFCRKGAPLQDICVDVALFYGGVQSKLLLRKKVASMLSHVPAGSSLKTSQHFIQLIKNSEFKQFDYGTEENIRRYGQAEPPFYDLSRITCPVALYYSTGDLVIDANDVMAFSRKLPNVVRMKKTDKFNHPDYQWASTARSLVYSDIIQLMENF